MLRLKKVSKRFKRKIIFNRINLEFTSPGLYLVKGKNGSGKTTLFNIIGGLSTVRGRINNDYKENMSYMFQNSYLIEYLSVKEHFELFNIDISVLNHFNLSEKLSFFPNMLSSGERQRVALLIALYSKRNLILLDEPFANLDEKNILIALDIIYKVKKDSIILIISHDIDCIKELDGVITVAGGKIKLNLLNKLNGKVNSQNIEKIRIKNDFKYHKFKYFKLYIFIILIFSLLFSISISKILVNKMIQTDIENSVDYNKFYLKECNEMYNNNFLISKCYNPSKESLSLLKENGVIYKYNYDYLLSYFFTNSNLSTMDNRYLSLKNGKYPENVYEVVANDQYDIGDIIEVEINLVVRDKKTDVYKEKIQLHVSGIYNDLKFYKDEKIYFHYDYLDEYLKSIVLKNNNFTIYEYFQKLDIDNYKYLSFNRLDVDNIVFEGEKYSYYVSLNELVLKTYDLLSKVEIFFYIFLFYNLFKTIKFLLISKQKTIAFLVANSFSRRKLIIKEFLYCFSIVFIIMLVSVFLYLFTFLDLIFLMRVLLVSIVLFLFVFCEVNMFFSRKRISNLMREEKW